MWKHYLSIATRVVNYGLVLLAFWFGIVESEYAHASFLLLLAMLGTNRFEE
jgi:hypothetical protein